MILHFIEKVSLKKKFHKKKYKEDHEDRVTVYIYKNYLFNIFYQNNMN